MYEYIIIKWVHVQVHIVQSYFYEITTLSFKPAQLLDEVRRVSVDSARKFHRFDSFQNQVVRLHRIGTGKWRKIGRAHV